MKTEDLLVLGLAGIAVVMILKAGKINLSGLIPNIGTAPTNSPSGSGYASEIWEGNGTTFDNGWRYFTDGTAIDPQGAYYANGVKVWEPPR